MIKAKKITWLKIEYVICVENVHFCYIYGREFTTNRRCKETQPQIPALAKQQKHTNVTLASITQHCVQTF